MKVHRVLVLVRVRKMNSDKTVDKVQRHRHLGVTLIEEDDDVGGNKEMSDHGRVLVRQLILDIPGRIV